MELVIKVQIQDKLVCVLLIPQSSKTEAHHQIAKCHIQVLHLYKDADGVFYSPS